jgi:hypothetical protein
MTTFNWHADYFDDRAEGAPTVRRSTIKAGNADDAGKIAKGQMGLCRCGQFMQVTTLG